MWHTIVLSAPLIRTFKSVCQPTANFGGAAEILEQLSWVYLLTKKLLVEQLLKVSIRILVCSFCLNLCRGN